VDVPPGIASRIDVDGADAFIDVIGRDGESHVGLEVGREGTGSSLHIAGGGQVDVEYIATIGGASAGSLTVEGEDSLLTAKLQLEVGRDGPGEVLVSGGARIDVNDSNGDPEVGEGYRGLVFVGMRAPGSLTIQGGGPSTASSLEAAAQMSVGAGAGGTLQVEQGAQLVTHRRSSATNTAGIVGRDSSGVGIATITDAGSVWDMPDGGLTVGWLGDGMMYVKDGGLVVCQHAIAGRAPDSRGEVRVWSEIENVESRWEIFGPLAVGGDLAGAAGGEARVVAGIRGVVYSPDLAIVYPPGAVELLQGVFEAAQGMELYGTLEGYGTLYGEIRNVDGIVRPHDGGTGLLPELAMADSYIQEAAGEFSVEVLGGVAGRIAVFEPGDTASLAGLLSVHVVPGTVPAVGSEYEIISAPGGVLGTFTAYNLPELDGQPVFEVIYEPDAVKLRALAEYRCKADLDLDLDVDSDDVGEFAACATRSGVPVAGESCRRADFDGDSDVDMDDFSVVQRCFTGNGMPASPACAQ
jgi:T5SS/PEP-CTERM-associated repeat protein